MHPVPTAPDPTIGRAPPSYTDALARKGNPCFACGAKNPRGDLRCRECNERLPIGAPLPADDAMRITRLGYARRAVLKQRQYVGVALVVVGFIAFSALLVINASAAALDAGRAIAVLLFLTGVVLFAWTQGRVSRMIFVQVALYSRGVGERIRGLPQRSSGVPAPPLAPDAGFGPTVPLRAWAAMSNAPPPREFASLMMASAPSPFHLKKSLRLTGDSGWRWEVSDGQGRPFAQVVIDPTLNRIFQLTASNFSLIQEYWSVRGPDGRVLGWFVEENRTDDVAGVGRVRLGFYDGAGDLQLRWEGNYATFPKLAAQLVQAYESLLAYGAPPGGDPVLRIAPGVHESGFRLVDGQGKPVAEARAAHGTKPGDWVVEVASGERGGWTVLATLAVAHWEPDGATFGIARMLGSNPELAQRLDARIGR
ncbi:MAG: hypothetical protein L3K15_08055 [Thermoplasmata archaeon]|nr:hypothetical protein [Thermoplasmata archaeon]